MKFSRKILTGALAGILAASSLAGMALSASAAGAGKVIDFSDMSDWYVYDHYYDSSVKYNSSTGSSPDASKTTDSKKPWYGWNEPYTAYVAQDIASNHIYKDMDEIRSGKVMDINTTIGQKKAYNVKHFAQHMFVEKVSDTNTNITFFGYGVGSIADFMMYPSTYDGVKTIDFEVDVSKTIMHTLDGVGMFANADIDGSGNMKGYLVYLQLKPSSADASPTSTDAYVIDMGAAGLTAHDIHNGTDRASGSNSIYRAISAGTGVSKIASNISIPDGRIKISMETGKTNINLKVAPFVGGNLQAAQSYTANIADNGLGGVGPLVQFLGEGHTCSRLSYVQFEYFLMAEGYSVRYDLNGAAGDSPVWNNSIDPIQAGITPGEKIGTGRFPSNNPTNGSKHFVGWNDQATGQGNPVTADTLVNSSINAYAIWRDDYATVNFIPKTPAKIKQSDGTFDEKTVTHYPEIKTGITEFPAVELPATGDATYLGWKHVEGNKVYGPDYIDISGKILKALDGLTMQHGDTHNFELVIDSDVNKDQIPDSEQALYTLEFKVDSSKGSFASSTAKTEFYVAGPKGSKNGDSIVIGSSTHDTVVVPVVNSGSAAFTGKWKDTKTGTTIDNADVLKYTITQNTVLEAVFDTDDNGDGIPDSEQALYVVEFKTAGSKGTQSGTAKYWVAGPQGSKQGDVVTIGSAYHIAEFGVPGVKVSFTAPSVTAIGSNAFLNEWEVGSTKYDESNISSWTFKDHTVLNAVFDSDDNGDGIPDSKQAKYEVKFEAGSDGSISGKTTATVIERGTTGGKGSDKLGNAIGGFTPPTAKPDAGYEFTGWVVKGTTGSLIDSADLEDEVISGDVTYVAQFVRSKPQGGGGVNGGFNITIQGPSNTTGGGTVEVMPGTKVGAANPPFVSPNDPKRYEVKTYTDQNGKSYTPDQIKNMVPTEDMTFTAVVTAKKR